MSKAIKIDENVKRLAPKQEVLRELYIKSGNQCAFPDCQNVLVDEKGNLVLTAKEYQRFWIGD